MMAKKRVALHVGEDEVAVVGPLPRWQHLVLVYETLAEEYPDDSDSWHQAADWIRKWIAKASLVQAEEALQ